MEESIETVDLSMIPEELVTEILLRLPVKSLSKFRCVSKPWRDLISSKQFIQWQLDYATKHPNFVHHNVILTSTISYETFRLKNFSLNSLLYNESTDWTELDYPMMRSKNIRYVGQCNGLCCIMIDQKDVFLWNPATRNSSLLPPTDPMFKCIVQRGFGFVDNDYKVLIRDHYNRHEILLYSLRTNSWKTVANFFENSFVNSMDSGKFANGNLHWIIKKYRGASFPSIVYFNLKTEVHGVVDLPTGAQSDSVFLNAFDTVGDYIALYSDHVWILNSDMCWNKIARIDHAHLSQTTGISCGYEPTIGVYGRFNPVSIMRNGEILMVPKNCLARDNTWIIVFCPKTNSYKKCVISNADKIELGKPACKIFETCGYVQSLVSPFTHEAA